MASVGTKGGIYTLRLGLSPYKSEMKPCNYHVIIRMVHYVRPFYEGRLALTPWLWLRVNSPKRPLGELFQRHNPSLERFYTVAHNRLMDFYALRLAEITYRWL